MTIDDLGRWTFTRWWVTSTATLLPKAAWLKILLHSLFPDRWSSRWPVVRRRKPLYSSYVPKRSSQDVGEFARSRRILPWRDLCLVWSLRRCGDQPRTATLNCSWSRRAEQRRKRSETVWQATESMPREWANTAEHRRWTRDRCGTEHRLVNRSTRSIESVQLHRPWRAARDEALFSLAFSLFQAEAQSKEQVAEHWSNWTLYCWYCNTIPDVDFLDSNWSCYSTDSPADSNSVDHCCSSILGPLARTSCNQSRTAGRSLRIVDERERIPFLEDRSIQRERKARRVSHGIESYLRPADKEQQEISFSSFACASPSNCRRRLGE